MTDHDFAEAIDALLWASPTGEMRDNTANYDAVRWSIEERGRAIELLHGVLVALLPLHPWREHERTAPPLLEALLFVHEQSAGEGFGVPTDESE
jgi:hypothetical protein